MKSGYMELIAKRTLAIAISCGALCFTACPVAIAQTTSTPSSTPQPSPADAIDALTQKLIEISKDPQKLSKSINDLAQTVATITAPSTPRAQFDQAIANLIQQAVSLDCPDDDFGALVKCNTDLLGAVAADVKANIDRKNVTPITTDQQTAIWHALGDILSLKVKDAQNVLSDDAYTRGIDYTNEKLDTNGALDLSKLQDSSSVMQKVQALMSKYATAANLTTLTKNKDAKASAAKIVSILQPFADAAKQDPRVNVLGAWYGNVWTIQRDPLVATFAADAVADAVAAAHDAEKALEDAVTAGQAAIDAIQVAQNAADDAARAQRAADSNPNERALEKTAQAKEDIARDLELTAQDKVQAAEDAAKAVEARAQEAKGRISGDKAKVGRDTGAAHVIALADKTPTAVLNALPSVQALATAAGSANELVGKAGVADAIKAANDKLLAAKKASSEPKTALKDASTEARKGAQRTVDRTAWSRGSEFCSATRAVRTRCQEQTVCLAATAASGGASVTASTEITPTLMCGSDPVDPSTAASDKVLVVRYECVSASADVWKTIGAAQNPQVQDAEQSRLAVLRAGAIGELRCQGQSS